MANDKTRFLTVGTPLGPAAVVAGAGGVCGVVLPGYRLPDLVEEVRRRFPGAVEDGRGLKTAAAAVAKYFETGRLPKRPPRLDLDGVGEFRRSVYDVLLGIPAGETLTYAEVARRIGRPGANRAVGTAVASNPVPLFVPCHRVVRSDGGLGGFTAEGGIALKERMLRLEGAR